ncbi:hypothetical protein DPQ33_14725 [Oceanidesulfovibrio indonesiensis]|uniref:Uncharacterized protein n=1 Tax=Oceanidesulfovibrio indonesiensis TaxID=54767 RepID=A0A7M3MBP7_9BACT|nr:hypothetical protein [Oceanidesulfovibrio indonesiensis]TVM15649.1 hypothetical protein DPQ33_14725 [Oceanidesulfovibrio indonesiensis]
MTGLWFLYWLPLVPIAIANGVLREFTYGKHLPELRTHQLGTLAAMAFFTVYFWIISHVWTIPSYGQAFKAGAFWVLLTILFEFGFGHYVMKQPWSRLLADYNVTKGRIWVLILFWTFMGPAMVRGFSIL